MRALAVTVALLAHALMACGDDDDAAPARDGGARESGGTIRGGDEDMRPAADRDSQAEPGGNEGVDGAARATDGSASDGGPAAGDAASDAGPSGCDSDPIVAEHPPLDLYVMLDRSDSMRELTAQGVTKWDAVREALEDFVASPVASGLGIGLQFFPLGKAGVPEHCFSDDDCGAEGGACASRACAPPSAPSSGQFLQCVSTADCPVTSAGCVPFGTCRNDSSLVCFNVGQADGCDTLGACDPFESTCMQFASCTVADYASPAVAIAPLPANAAAFMTALTATSPVGLTPMSPALAGAIDRATAHAASNTDHRVAVLLASDGLPTECVAGGVSDPAQAIAEVAQVAAAGRAREPAVLTYAIGIHVADDPNPIAGLESVAHAGGSEHAFDIDASSTVHDPLIAALTAIQGDAVACEYRIPSGPPIRVDIAGASGSDQLTHVDDASACGAGGGWYFEPSDPLRIELCPSSCTAARAPDAKVELRPGCG